MESFGKQQSGNSMNFTLHLALFDLIAGRRIIIHIKGIKALTAYGEPAISRYTPALGSKFQFPIIKSCKLTKTTMMGIDSVSKAGMTFGHAVFKIEFASTATKAIHDLLEVS